MTIGSARKGPGPMPAVVAGLLVSIILTRWFGWKTAFIVGAFIGIAVNLIILLTVRTKG